VLAVASGMIAWHAADVHQLSVRPDGTTSGTRPTPRVVAGVPEGYADSPEGARQAAMGFVQIEAGSLMAHPDAYRAAWQEMCTPDYYASQGRARAEEVLTQQEAINHLISNAANGQPVYERAVPLTATLASGGAATASVRTWSLLIQHPGDGPTTVTFAAGIVELRWTDGTWKLDGGSGLSTLGDGTSGALQLSAGPGLPGYLDSGEAR